MEPTKAPWAKPHNSESKDDLPMTAAPWSRNASTADAAIAPLPARHGMTGKPIAAIIEAEASLPQWEGNRSFRAPEPVINSEAALKRFLQSDTIKSFVGFILALNESVKGKKISEPCHMSAEICSLVDTLQTLSRWVDEVPPLTQPLRYGNPAFKQWLSRVADAAPQLVAEVLPQHLKAAAQELALYFQQSFGNATRIDYGTGHEMTFCAFLYCLMALGILDPEDSQAVVTRVFSCYLQLMRKVQTTYWHEYIVLLQAALLRNNHRLELVSHTGSIKNDSHADSVKDASFYRLEPAGSRGVWGLDDYQFMPFIWGAAQLISHPTIKPSSIHAAKVLDEHADEFLYLECVRFVKQVKKGPLRETSPLLDDISGVPNWEKVNSGMVKMYEAEVLSKFPIMQHFLCGTILPFQG